MKARTSVAASPTQVELAGNTLKVDHAGAPTKVSIRGSRGCGVPYVVRDAKGRIVREGITR